jgi:hypothetical protein
MLMAQQSVPVPFFMPPRQAMLAAVQAQNAGLLAAQQQAMLAAMPKQNVNLVAGRPPQPQRNPVAVQVRAVPVPAPAAAGPQQPEDPEEAAARQLKIARVVLAEADAVAQNGERDRAAKMRARVNSRLQSIIARYPETKAAEGAGELLDKIGD